MSVETDILSRFVENKITNRLGFNSRGLPQKVGEYNNELEVRFDNWGASPGAMATGFGLMMTPALTLGMGAITLAPFVSAFGRHRKS